jgi:N-acyl-D-aspartate/D-glutamate deacylase
LVGASDAGAHLDLTTTFTFGTSVLRAAREHELMSLEEGVHAITDRPASLYGIRDRGRIVEGAYADMVLFEADRIGPGQIYWRDDLPRGAGRLYADPEGVHHVLTNGREIVNENALTGETPGTILHSGRDTQTVTAR